MNHIPNNDVLTTKLGLLNSLRDYFCNPSRSSVGGANNSSIIFESALDADSLTERLPTPWLPESYQLDLLSDCLALRKDDEKYERESAARGETSTENMNLWIFKPSCSNRGRGVYVLKGGNELNALIDEYNPIPQVTISEKQKSCDKSNLNSSCKEQYRLPTKGLVQKYLTKPLLVDGYKFDIRCYLLVSQNDPFYIAYYHPGYVRYCFTVTSCFPL